MPSFPLPVHHILPRLCAELARQPAVIITAPPGSGKTTLTAPALLEAEWLVGQKILLLQPRRLAARLVATFMARQLNETVGQSVGYRVRFESRISEATRLEVLTEGMFTRQLQNDPELAGTGLVIFDEFHERSLDADLALALCLDAQQGLRPDLKILLMSATLDITPLSALLHHAPVLEAAGRSYPVSIEYFPPPAGAQPYPREIAGHTAAAIRRAWREQPGDILAFLPGAGEIRLCRQMLHDQPPTASVLPGPPTDAPLLFPLYGDLPLADQAAAVQPDPAGRRRIILATAIAETSLTIEGIHTVVDSGWQRRPRFDPNSGLTRLTTGRISRAAATQRTGRAGRLGPGHCLRLWSPGEEQSRPAFEPPEILNADLAPLRLELACWGVHEPAQLTWLDPPPPGPWAQAGELLTALGALDRQGRATEQGRLINQLPVHPRLGLMLLRANETGATATAADLAALLSERDIIKGRDKSADLDERLEALQAWRRNKSASKRSAGAAAEIDGAGCRRVERTARQLRSVLPRPRRVSPDNTLDSGELLALAYPDRIARQRPSLRGKYKLSGGRGASLPPHDRLAASEYLAVAELDAGRTEGRIFLAAALAPEALSRLFPQRLQSRDELYWDQQAGAVKGQRRWLFDQLELAAEPLANPDPAAVQRVLLQAVTDHGLQLLPWNDQAREFQARLACIGQWQPEGNWPRVDDEYLRQNLEQWLSPWLAGIRTADQLGRLNLTTILAGLLDYRQKSYLEQEVPTHLQVPSGSRRKLSYQPGGPPVLAVRLQEMFGLADTPRIVQGRVPVLLHLLSPAGRPVQITSDLRGFWDSGYHQVKKELQGRYPKHHWPDNPWQAQPTARAKPRR
ncbi:ATP-dependent helicase HrpB [Desulfurivibrio dismutans]|uniref:ATP-dependent helicase HrpB n=1 Tax=Desulfurivibrio dismutans TaxID=1398908 RepID=UPI0023DA6559|nr:ATP-dependent helicase HrpB [Desulfurivibrio alkaliphilus]MDF1614850.1 ATP-dependent helicase HrpB [Desulfurivibrio alkaliphilus]